MRARPISCCFSGHRPGKLPWGDDEGDRRCLALKERLVQNGDTVVITAGVPLGKSGSTNLIKAAIVNEELM